MNRAQSLSERMRWHVLIPLLSCTLPLAPVLPFLNRFKESELFSFRPPATLSSHQGIDDEAHVVRRSSARSRRARPPVATSPRTQNLHPRSRKASCFCPLSIQLFPFAINVRCLLLHPRTSISQLFATS